VEAKSKRGTTMGNAAPQVKTAAGAAQRDPLNYLQHDLPKLIKKNELGTGKFMKSFLCKMEEGTPVVVKVYVRHEGETQEELDRARVKETHPCSYDSSPAYHICSFRIIVFICCICGSLFFSFTFRNPFSLFHFF
jgi:hypothetical protein